MEDVVVPVVYDNVRSVLPGSAAFKRTGLGTHYDVMGRTATLVKRYKVTMPAASIKDQYAKQTNVPRPPKYNPRPLGQALHEIETAYKLPPNSNLPRLIGTDRPIPIEKLAEQGSIGGPLGNLITLNGMRFTIQTPEDHAAFGGNTTMGGNNNQADEGVRHAMGGAGPRMPGSGAAFPGTPPPPPSGGGGAGPTPPPTMPPAGGAANMAYEPVTPTPPPRPTDPTVSAGGRTASEGVDTPSVGLSAPITAAAAAVAAPITAAAAAVAAPIGRIARSTARGVAGFLAHRGRERSESSVSSQGSTSTQVPGDHYFSTSPDLANVQQPAEQLAPAAAPAEVPMATTPIVSPAPAGAAEAGTPHPMADVGGSPGPMPVTGTSPQRVLPEYQYPFGVHQTRQGETRQPGRPHVHVLHPDRRIRPAGSTPPEMRQDTPMEAAQQGLGTTMSYVNHPAVGEGARITELFHVAHLMQGGEMGRPRGHTTATASSREYPLAVGEMGRPRGHTIATASPREYPLAVGYVPRGLIGHVPQAETPPESPEGTLVQPLAGDVMANTGLLGSPIAAGESTQGPGGETTINTETMATTQTGEAQNAYRNRMRAARRRLHNIDTIIETRERMLRGTRNTPPMDFHPRSHQIHAIRAERAERRRTHGRELVTPDTPQGHMRLPAGPGERPGSGGTAPIPQPTPGGPPPLLYLPYQSTSPRISSNSSNMRRRNPRRAARS